MVNVLVFLDRLSVLSKQEAYLCKVECAVRDVNSEFSEDSLSFGNLDTLQEVLLSCVEKIPPPISNVVTVVWQEVEKV